MATRVTWTRATVVMSDAGGHATTAIRPDHRQRPIGEHRRRQRYGDDEHGNR